MSDSMTKDDVLSALGEISQHFENCMKATYGGSHERFHRWMNAADWAAAYLNDPAPTITDWISVKDSTPTEMHLNCWVMIKGCPDPMIDRWEGDRGEESTYGFPEDEKTFVKSGWYYNDCNEVTHWMPIRTPEPPEEVTGDA